MILGATSWQVPGTYLDNARLLAEHATFSELLVYTWNEEMQSTLERDWDDMSGLLRLSVHLPADSLEHAAEALRFFSGRNVLRYTIHPVMDVLALRNFLSSGVDLVGERLCLENLENDVFETVMPRVEDIPFSITMDFGHLLFTHASADRFVDAWGARVQEIHFHGYDGTNCHVEPDEGTLSNFGRLMDSQFGDRADVPVCVETFDWSVTLGILESLASHSAITAGA
ncbi:MAG: cobamide remodeling phosphodiesterase CbiR [Candidatus Cryosericum sp.]